MSYESNMFDKFKMPERNDVERTLLIAIFNHNGSIREFTSNEHIVKELSDHYNLSTEQRNAYLETVYKKENRLKKSLLWHRLLFRAADNLAKEKLITRPSQTLKITNRREWMLTELGYDKVLETLKIPIERKEVLPIISFEIQKNIKKLKEANRPDNYIPYDKENRILVASKVRNLRSRTFRLAILEEYNYRCAICGLKIHSPDKLIWEVEAAHIVPKKDRGKDDIWNGLALCHLHHWAFDVGWFTIQDNYKIILSKKVKSLTPNYGRMGNFEFLKAFNSSQIVLPNSKATLPHRNSLSWHRKNIFHE